MRYFKQIKDSYYSHGITYSIGNIDECSAFSENNGKRISWGKQPEQELLENIEFLALLPTEKQIKNIEIYFKLLLKLPNLKDLISPIELFEQKENISLFFKTLNLNKFAVLEKIRKNDLSNITFNNLELLVINDTYNLNESIDLCVQKLPVLEFLETPLSDSGFCSIDNILKLKNIRHLILRHCKSKKIENLSSKNFYTLGITNYSKELDFIGNITSLEILHFNTIRSEINCNIFKQLPNLKEISILNSKKIINIETLLECKNLRSIYFFRCDNIFKNLKQVFKDKGYDYIDIDYS